MKKLLTLLCTLLVVLTLTGCCGRGTNYRHYTKKYNNYGYYGYYVVKPIYPSYIK